MLTKRSRKLYTERRHLDTHKKSNPNKTGLRAVRASWLEKTVVTPEGTSFGGHWDTPSLFQEQLPLQTNMQSSVSESWHAALSPRRSHWPFPPARLTKHCALVLADIPCSTAWPEPQSPPHCALVFRVVWVRALCVTASDEDGLWKFDDPLQKKQHVPGTLHFKSGTFVLPQRLSIRPPRQWQLTIHQDPLDTWKDWLLGCQLSWRWLTSYSATTQSTLRIRELSMSSPQESRKRHKPSLRGRQSFLLACTARLRGLAWESGVVLSNRTPLSRGKGGPCCMVHWHQAWTQAHVSRDLLLAHLSKFSQSCIAPLIFSSAPVSHSVPHPLLGSARFLPLLLLPINCHGLPRSVCLSFGSTVLFQGLAPDTPGGQDGIINPTNHNVTLPPRHGDHDQSMASKYSLSTSKQAKWATRVSWAADAQKQKKSVHTPILMMIWACLLKKLLPVCRCMSGGWGGKEALGVHHEQVVSLDITTWLPISVVTNQTHH